VFINSGNMRNPRAAAEEWILDETVWVINDIAEGLVRSDPKYATYARSSITRSEWGPMPSSVTGCSSSPTAVVLPRCADRSRPHRHRCPEKTIVADVEEWFELMTAYHDTGARLGRRNEELDGQPATPAALEDRMTIMRAAMETIFAGRSEFNACWTYITCERPAED